MSKIILIIGSMSFGIIVGAIAFDNPMKSNQQLVDMEHKEKDSLPKLTKENVLKEIILADIKEPLIVYRQVLKETGHLKCKGCSLKYNNLFGFTSKKMIKFNHWIDSIAFYKEWQKQYKEGDYYTFLIKVWGAPNMEKYVETLKQIKI